MKIFSFLKQIILILMILQGYLMSATLIDIEIKGVKIPVIFEVEKHLPLASMELIFQNSGSLADTTAGIARFSAKILGEGTKKEGAVNFAKSLEDRAIELHAQSGRETFVISLEALKSEFDFAVNRLNDLLSDPNLTPEAFKKVQTQTLGELQQKRSNFDYIASINLRKILFENTPLAHSELGSISSIKNLKLKEVKSYIKNHLYLNNLIVVMGGSLKKKEIQALLKKALSSLDTGKVKEIPHFGANTKERQVVTKEKSDQAYIYFGAPYEMRANDPKRIYGKVASFILGSSGFGSRLMEEIRVKRGLAYSAYSRFAVNRTNSYFSGYLQTKIASEKEAQKLVKEVIDNFIKNGVTASELESAKKFFLGSEPLRSETLDQRMNRAFHEYYDGVGLGYFKKELEAIENMKLKDLNNFIKSHKEIGKLSWSIVTSK